MRVIIGFVVAILTFSFSSCKKGENDPVFSLKSRKARLTGVWVVESAEWAGNDTISNFDGTTLEIGDSSGTIMTYGFNITMTFDNEGAYSCTRNTTYDETSSDTTLIGVACEDVESGWWNFTGGAGKTKQKSQLLLLKTKTENSCSNSPFSVNTITTAGQNQGLVYNIDRLSDSELTLKYEVELTTAIGINTRSAEIILKKEEN